MPPLRVGIVSRPSGTSHNRLPDAKAIAIRPNKAKALLREWNAGRSARVTYRGHSMRWQTMVTHNGVRGICCLSLNLSPKVLARPAYARHRRGWAIIETLPDRVGMT